MIVKAQKGLSDILKAISDKPINYSPTSKSINTYNLSNDQLDNIYRSDGKKIQYKFDDLDSKQYEANRYLEKGDEYGFTYSLGTINLPDLEVKPTQNTWNYVDWLKQQIPNKRVRNTMAHTANNIRSRDPQQEVITRIVELYNNAGRPKIQDVSNSNVNLYGQLTDDDKYKNRPNYNPINNTMYLNQGDWHYGGSYNANDFIAELSHPYLSHLQGPIKAYIGLPGDIKINGKDGYHRKGHPEYNAHKIVQPSLHSYIRGSSALSHPKNINQLNSRIKRYLDEE